MSLVCHQECNQCTGPTAFDCVACKHISYQGECLSQCPHGTALAPPSYSVCEGILPKSLDCSKRCAVCSAPHDFDSCSECNQFYEFDGLSTCKLLCSSHYEYYDMVTGDC